MLFKCVCDCDVFSATVVKRPWRCISVSFWLEFKNYFLYILLLILVIIYFIYNVITVGFAFGFLYRPHWYNLFNCLIGIMKKGNYDLVMIIIIHDYKVIKHTQAKRNFIFLIKLLSKITNTTWILLTHIKLMSYIFFVNKPLALLFFHFIFYFESFHPVCTK